MTGLHAVESFAAFHVVLKARRRFCGPRTTGMGPVVRLLLEHNADVNAKDDDGWTALLKAAENGHEAVVRPALEHNVNVNMKDDDKWTAPFRAAKNMHETVVRLLLEHKADVDAKDGYCGLTALY
jgi:ankyrin repeat protein